MAKAEKAFASMLRLAINEAVAEGGTRLRVVADALVTKAMAGDVAAIKEVADRIDGKVPQAIVGDDEHDPIGLNINAERFTRAIAGLATRDGTPEAD